MVDKPNDIFAPKGYLEIPNPSNTPPLWWVELYERLAKNELRLEMHETNMKTFADSITARFDKSEASAKLTDAKIDEIRGYFRVGRWGANAVWAILVLAVMTFGAQFVGWLLSKH